MAMNETVISWNVTNWITVILMAAVGIAILGVIEKAVVSAKGASA